MSVAIQFDVPPQVVLQSKDRHVFMWESFDESPKHVGSESREIVVRQVVGHRNALDDRAPELNALRR